MCESLGGCMNSEKGPWLQFERVPPRWVKRKECCEEGSQSDWNKIMDESNIINKPFIFKNFRNQTTKNNNA